MFNTLTTLVRNSAARSALFSAATSVRGIKTVQYTYLPTFRKPDRVPSKATLERRLRKSESNSLTKEQFARTRKPFDFPVKTKLPIEERKPSHDALMQQIRAEERDKLALLPRQIEDFKVGDKVAITSLISLGSDKLELVKGLVIAKRRKNHLDANFTIRNVCMGVGYELTFPLYSPFLRSVRVLERGQNVRRAKLYYLRDIPKADRRNKPI